MRRLGAGAGLIVLLLAGCAQLPVDLSGQAAGDEADALRQANELSGKGEWSRAIGLLRQASRRYPENRALRDQLDQLIASWARERQLLDDRILLIDAEAQVKKLPLLEQLARGDQGDVLLKTRRLFWREYALTHLDGLRRCGETHRQRHPWLARRCLELAQTIAASPETAQRLDEVNRIIASRRQATEQRQQRTEQRAREQRVRKLLEQAGEDLRQGRLTDAMGRLDEALRLDPENPQVRRLLTEAQSGVNRQVESLVKLGDRLYRDEQIGPAVAVWETALRLDPGQQSVIEKIARARRVIEKLERIRSRPN